MAEEIAEPVVVEATVDHTASSFNGWSPNTPPVEEAAPVVVEAAPAAEGGEGTNEPTTDPAKNEWYRQFGEFTDQDAFKGHYETLKTEREQLDARLKEAEGKAVGYSSEAIAQMDAYAKKLQEEGLTDAKEIQRKVLARMQEATADYIDIAKTNPVSIIERSIREKYTAMGASAEAIDRAVRKGVHLPEKPNLADYGNDATDEGYIEKMEAYQDAHSDLELKALEIALEMEAKREKIDFQPKGVMTPEQRQKAHEEAWGRYNARIPQLNEEIAKIGIPVEGDYAKAIQGVVDNPNDFINQFYTKEGEPDVVAIGSMQAKIASIPYQIAKAVKEAVHKHTEAVDGKLQNPNGTNTPPNPGGTPNVDPEESFRIWEKERQSHK